MSGAVANLQKILGRMRGAEARSGRESGITTLVAVTKTFDADAIIPVLEAGHRVFGENRVQEAGRKWPALRERFPDIELHLIGPLQSNKAGEAVALFDVIETIDREKIAAALGAEMDRQGRRPKLLVQVNTGREPQKAGVLPQDTLHFVSNCRDRYGLEISGLMCIPPVDEDPAPHFRLLGDLARQCGVRLLSMGMSGDFETAIEQGATHVRVGSAIFGTR